MLKVVFFTAIFIKGTSCIKAQTPEMQWQHVYPNPTGSWLSGAAWGPPGFVATGSNGEILFSADAKQWKRIIVEGAKVNSFEAVCFHDGKYVAVGTRNVIANSSDGQNWMVVNTETSGWLNACAGGSGMFVALGFNQTMLVSSNSVDWQKRTAPVPFRDIAFGNGMWVAVTGGSTIYASPNLLDWTQVQTGAVSVFTNSANPASTSINVGFFDGPLFTRICFGDGRFVVGGALGSDTEFGGYATVMKTSTNGLDWDGVSLAGVDIYGETRGMAFGNGIFVAAHKRDILRSTNGISWEKAIAPDADGDLAGVAASDGGQFVAVGANGAMLRSDDGAMWQVVSTDARTYIYNVAWAKGRFVVAEGRQSYVGGPLGAAAVLTSTNGFDWQASLTNLVDRLSGVAYGGGLWVVTGDDGQIFTSRNGVDWTDHSLPPTSHDLYQVVYGKGRFIAFSEYRDLVYRSMNGKRWVAIESPLASEISKAKFLNGHFIGVGGDQDGFIFSSGDGVKWAKTTLTNAGWLAGAAYGKGRYVVAGRNSSAISFDSIEWSVHQTPRSIYDLQYVDGWFVGVGPGGLEVSRDGVEWQMMNDPALPDRLSALAYGAGALVSAEGSTLYRGSLQDSEVFRRTLRTLSPAQFELYEAKGFQYRLERSTDLKNWTPATEWRVGQDNYEVWKMGSFQGSAMFWRTASKPK